MRTQLITAPSDLPLSEIEARLHLRNPEVTEDSELIAFIRSAVAVAEHKTGRKYIRQTWEAYLDRFPTCYYPGAPNCIELPHVPLQSVVSITYLDANAAEQTMPNTDYVVDSGPDIARIRLAVGKTWPVTYYWQEAVTIQYVTGYADIDDIPENVLHWIKLFVETSDKHRGMMGDKEMYEYRFADHLLDPEKANLGV